MRKKVRARTNLGFGGSLVATITTGPWNVKRASCLFPLSPIIGVACLVSHCAQHSHPPDPPIASQSISRDVPVARARASDFPYFALREAARLSFTARIEWLHFRIIFCHDPLLLLAGWPAWSPTARNDSPLHPFKKGVAKAALSCAHRTSTFLSCAFCEQEGHLAAPCLFLDKKKKRRL
jgi:hypothetical protein